MSFLQKLSSTIRIVSVSLVLLREYQASTANWNTL
jgi:hypothetical protein